MSDSAAFWYGVAAFEAGYVALLQLCAGTLPFGGGGTFFKWPGVFPWPFVFSKFKIMVRYQYVSDMHG